MSSDRQPWHFILAVDGSEHSLAAADLLMDLQLQHGSLIDITTVQSDRHRKADPTLADNYLRGLAEKLRGSGVDVAIHIVYGHPAKEIVRQAELLNPDLIIMGAKGLRATIGIFLGGVVQQVVEYARWPSLVVRAPYQGIEKVIFTTDGSPFSNKAERFIEAFPWKEGTAIQVVHVLPPMPRQDLGYPSWYGGGEVVVTLPNQPVVDDIEWIKEEETRGKNLVNEVVLRLRESGQSATGLVVRGDAATEIIHISEREKAGMIIVGSRGLSQMESWLLGSVTRKLVHYSNCSVLIVKQN